MPPMRMVHDEDPAELIFKKAGMKDGKIPGFELMANRVLIGLYIRPEKTKSGIILSDNTRGEERFQGKAAVVLAMGPSAFVSDSSFDFQGQKLQVGDWVSIWTSDGRAININGCDARVIRDQDIAMKIPMPDAVF